MPGPSDHEMHRTKVFIRKCEKLGEFLESRVFRAVCKKADVCIIWKRQENVLIATVLKVSEYHRWFFVHCLLPPHTYELCESRRCIIFTQQALKTLESPNSLGWKGP